MIESELIECRAGDVHITPEQIGDVNIGTYGPEDYVLGTGNKVKAELITNNTVRLFDGVMVYCGIRDAVPVNKYYDITIDNGSQGKNRNDIIVRRYTKDDDSSQKARSVFSIVKGTPSDGTATDPEIPVTDIRAGALTHDMKLHRVRLEGLNIVAVEPLFDVLMPMSEQQAMLTELNKNSIIESDRNDNGYYEKYANGECRMWGTASVASNGICTVNLPIPFSDVTYRPYATPVYNPENTHAVTIASVQNDTTSRFYIYAREIDGTIPKTGTKYNWEAIGTWK